MAAVLQLVKGVPRMVDISTGGTSFDEEELLGAPLTAATNYTIPNGKTYVMGTLALSVFVDGNSMRVGTDYTEVSSTQIVFPSRTINVNSRIRVRG